MTLFCLSGMLQPNAAGLDSSVALFLESRRNGEVHKSGVDHGMNRSTQIAAIFATAAGFVGGCEMALATA